MGGLIMTKKDICIQFLDSLGEFRWFIEEYFGDEAVEKLKNYAKEGNEFKLRSALNEIWFRLPDDIFNIRENPKGWAKFLQLIEE